MLKFTNLTYYKHFKKILNNINLIVDDKDFIIIIGDNGCGKTTILKIIVKSIHHKAYNSNFKDIFFLSDKFVLPSNRYVKDFLYKSIDIFKASINIELILADLEVPNQKIKTLSKGNYKKVAIIYSFLTKADVVVYDEILDGLDKLVIKKIIKYLKTLNKTIILVTHNLKPFRYLSYRLIEVKAGEIISEKENRKTN